MILKYRFPQVNSKNFFFTCFPIPNKQRALKTGARLSISQNVYIFVQFMYRAYQRVRNVSFSENFAHVLDEWSFLSIHLLSIHDRLTDWLTHPSIEPLKNQSTNNPTDQPTNGPTERQPTDQSTNQPTDRLLWNQSINPRTDWPADRLIKPQC